MEIFTQNVNTQSQKGFTLIELMITVAIMAILVTIALPAYQKYSIRSRVTEGFSLATAAKLNVADIASTGYHSGAGYNMGYTSPSPTNNLTSLVLDGATGAITLNYTAVAANAIVTLTPTGAPVLTTGATENFAPAAEPIKWACGHTAPTLAIHVPPSCR